MSFALFTFLKNKLNKLQLATEKRLTPLEEQFHALARANINMEPTVTETAIGGIASLPKNAAEAPFNKFVLEGNTQINIVENILKSGNFQDMSHWNIYNIDPERLHPNPYERFLLIEFSGDDFYFSMSQNLPYKEGHRYYVRGEIQCLNCGMLISVGALQREVYDGQQYELVSFLSDSPTLSFMIIGFYGSNPRCYLRNWMVIDLGDESSPLYNKTEEELDELFTEYFDGAYSYAPIQHASGSYRIRRVGKNLFDVRRINETYFAGPIAPNHIILDVINSKIEIKGDNTHTSGNGYIVKVKPNTTYTIRFFVDSTNVRANVNISNLYNLYARRIIINATESQQYKQHTFMTAANEYELKISFNKEDDEGYTTIISKIQLEEGTTATPYEPYSAQDVYVNCGELRRLPNGVCDEYSVLEGIKTERTKEYILQANDIIEMYTGGTYVDFIVAKGTYANLVAAQTALAGTKLIYQLAEPITIPYYPQVLTSKPSGTIYCEPVLGDADFYGQGIALEGFTFTSIERVTKVDLESGIEIDITDTCTLNEAKNGFTSTALQAGDICWYELRIDPETTLIPEMEYAYYDSRYVVVDDSNGKYYRWKIASTNGTPRIELEEV
ncbi:MAG TPA: hypothetical protein GXX14_04670 [Clostridiaceae bacterium]|nr:hypothetical protein [Clostridiaceae bacterium]